MRIKSKKGFIVTIAAAVCLFMVLNVLNHAYLKGIYYDLTENNLYTISGGTKNIINRLEEPVKFDVFFSRKQMNGIPYLKSYASRVISLLKQYENIGNGKIELNFINPGPFTQEEDEALRSGMQPIPVDDSGGKLYFGMVASDRTGNKRKIPFFNPDREPFLEYDITRIIHDLSRPEKPVLGLISTVPEEGARHTVLPDSTEDEWVIFRQLENQFRIQDLGTDPERIPGDIDLLLIVHPHNFSEDTLYAIDQFVLSGGNALVFTDSYLEINGTDSKSSDLSPLFEKWGVEFHSSRVVADQDNALRVNYREGDSGVRSVTKLNWLLLQSSHLENDIITADLGQLRVASSGFFTDTDNHNTEFYPLVKTGDNSVAIDPSLTHSPYSVLANYISSDKSVKNEFVIAGRITGKVETAFPEREETGHITTSKEPVNLIVFGDVDMLRDMFWVRKQNLLNTEYLVQTADNSSFVNNALENLSGSNDLISLRSRSKVDRPFEVVNQLRLEAEKKYLQEEKRLQTRLGEIETRLDNLQNSVDTENNLVVNDTRQREIDRYREEIVRTRSQLREVKHNLHKDIERLGAVIKFINIGLLPLLVIILGFFVPGLLGIKRS